MSSTVSTQLAPEQSTAVRKREAASATERIGSLDVLAGIALLGMFLVHFYDFATDPGGARGVTAVYRPNRDALFRRAFLDDVRDPVRRRLRRAASPGRGRGRSLRENYVRRLSRSGASVLRARGASASTCCSGYAGLGISAAAGAQVVGKDAVSPSCQRGVRRRSPFRARGYRVSRGG